jgi:hypothetical protein
MKSSYTIASPTSEIDFTCETDESELFEIKFLPNSSPENLSPGRDRFLTSTSDRLIKNLHSEKILCISKTPEKLEIEFERTEGMFWNQKLKDMIIEVEEDHTHNWLPDPAFVHGDSMNIQTPRISFSPSKPRMYLNTPVQMNLIKNW